jgi:hypothetical protein
MLQLKEDQRVADQSSIPPTSISESVEKTFQTGPANLQAAGQYKFVQSRGAASGASRVSGRQTGDKVAGVEKGTPELIAPRGHIPTTGTANKHGMALPAAWTQNLQVPSRSNERGNVGKLSSVMAILSAARVLQAKPSLGHQEAKVDSHPMGVPSDGDRKETVHALHNSSTRRKFDG